MEHQKHTMSKKHLLEWRWLTSSVTYSSMFLDYKEMDLNKEEFSQQIRHITLTKIEMTFQNRTCNQSQLENGHSNMQCYERGCRLYIWLPIQKFIHDCEHTCELNQVTLHRKLKCQCQKKKRIPLKLRIVLMSWLPSWVAQYASIHVMLYSSDWW